MVTCSGASIAAEIRAKSRTRRLNGRRNPLGGVVAEFIDVAAGPEFELPAHYAETEGRSGSSSGFISNKALTGR